MYVYKHAPVSMPRRLRRCVPPRRRASLAAICLPPTPLKLPHLCDSS